MTATAIKGRTTLFVPGDSGSAAFSGARLAQAADYVVTPSSFIQFPWDTVVFDEGGYVGSNGGNVCFIAPATAYYVVHAVEDWFIARKAAAPRKAVRTWIQTTALGDIAIDGIILEPSAITADYHIYFNLNTGPVLIESGDTVQLGAQDTLDADTVNGTTFFGTTFWTIMRVGT